MLNIEQGGIKYHFWVFGMTTWDWTIILMGRYVYIGTYKNTHLFKHYFYPSPG